MFSNKSVGACHRICVLYAIEIAVNRIECGEWVEIASRVLYCESVMRGACWI